MRALAAADSDDAVDDASAALVAGAAWSGAAWSGAAWSGAAWFSAAWTGAAWIGPSASAVVAADGIVVETGGLATAWTDGGASPTAPETAAAPTPAKAEVCVDADAGGACDEAAWIGRVCEDPDATSDAGGIGARTEARFSLAPPNGGVELGTVCPSVVDANVWGEEVWGVGGAAASASAVGDGDDPLVCGKAEVCAVEIWGEAGCAEGICAVDGDDGIGLETAGGAASETAVVRGAGAGVSWA